eukprot:366163-Chlamydomonas_euryale.AAC.3
MQGVHSPAGRCGPRWRAQATGLLCTPGSGPWKGSEVRWSAVWAASCGGCGCMKALRCAGALFGQHPAEVLRVTDAKSTKTREGQQMDSSRMVNSSIAGSAWEHMDGWMDIGWVDGWMDGWILAGRIDG